MCGIFGISYGPGGPESEPWTPTEMAQLMFPAIVHRGPHAFGWMSFNPDTGISVVKHKGKANHKRNLGKVDIDPQATWVVGHVRWATNGTPEYMGNNHPLTHGSVVGVHNGVLRDWEPILAETGREDDVAEVDSEAIFAAVNKWGLDGLKRINGNMVTVFTQTAHPELLHIARTVGRPLVYATTPNGSLIFASEQAVIEACGYDMTDGDYTDMTGQYRRLAVVAGKIVERAQFRTPPPPRPLSARPTFTSSSTAYERGVGSSGITDFFDRQQNKKPRRTSLDHPRALTARTDTPRSGTKPGEKDSVGGEYMGAGWYRTPDGKIMPVDKYVEWRVQNELTRIDHEGDIHEAVNDAEQQAQQIINGL